MGSSVHETQPYAIHSLFDPSRLYENVAKLENGLENGLNLEI